MHFAVFKWGVAMDNKEAYHNLANAIIIRACEDYVTGEITDCSFKRFCRSNWFRILTNVKPEYLIEKMEIKREVYLNEKKEKSEKRYKK